MEFNFIHPNNLGDKELFFGPLKKDETFLELDTHMTMAHVMFQAGSFSSISQARKNGWDKPIPDGFTDMRVGKLKRRVTILNKF